MIATGDKPIECVVYEQEKHDTHAAYDQKTKTYTFVNEGEYIVAIGSMLFKKRYKAGETVVLPKMVIGQGCGMFYKSIEVANEPR